MLNSLSVALRVVLPMAITMGVGYLVRTAGIVNREDMGSIDRLIFKVLMPCLLFKNIYYTDLTSHFFHKEAAFTFISIGLIFVLAVFLPPHLVSDRRQAASIGQAVFRCNYVLFGVAVTESIYGKGNAGLTALLGAIVVPVTNAMSIVFLERARNQQASPKKLLRAILTNAMVIAAILALCMKFLKIEMPETFLTVVEDFAGITTTISFISLGASLNIRELHQNRRPIVIGVLLRMILLPIIFLPITVALGFREKALCAFIILFASPTAISTYPMAIAMDADGPLSGQLVCITTVMSVISMFLLVFLFQSLGLL